MIRARAVLPAMMLFLLALPIAGGCRSQIQLGGVATDAGTDGSVPPVCSTDHSRVLVATADTPLGDFRAMAVADGTLWLLSARTDTNEGVVSRVSVAGSTLVQLATVGTDPQGLAVTSDGAYVFVAARGSSQVARIDTFGTVTVAYAGGMPSGIVTAAGGGAAWTLPANDSVWSWDFMTAAPQSIVTSPHAMSITRYGQTLYMTGDTTLRTFVPGVDATTHLLSNHCDSGIPALTGTSLYCAESGSIVSVDITSGETAILATGQTAASDIVTGDGRVFWRTTDDGSDSYVIALPLDGTSGTTVLESGPAGPLLIAQDDCSIYFTENNAIYRRGF